MPREGEPWRAGAATQATAGRAVPAAAGAATRRLMRLLLRLLLLQLGFPLAFSVACCRLIVYDWCSALCFMLD